MFSSKDMDMLVPYTPISELTEEEKKRLKKMQLPKTGFVNIDGKVVSANEAQTLKPSTPAVRQNLFE